MNRLILFFSVTVLLLSACAKPQQLESTVVLRGNDKMTGVLPVESSVEMKLAQGDTVNISVWGQENLSKSVKIDPDGNIYFPLAGKIKAAGLNTEQLAAQITILLQRYYIDPVVTVIPEELAGQGYYVLGEVGKPGKFIIQAQTAIMEAVAEAGGPSKDAADRVILLRRQTDKLHIYSLPFTYGNEIGQNNLASINTVLQPRDILYVPPSHIADAERFMSRLSTILTPLLDLERGILYWPQLVDALKGSSSEVLVR